MFSVIFKVSFIVKKFQLFSSLISKKLKDNKSPGPDNIGPKLVKVMEYAIIDPLEYIFNICLNSGKVPTKMKTAKIIPVFKKG